jgi:hypothetical protein
MQKFQMSAPASTTPAATPATAAAPAAAAAATAEVIPSAVCMLHAARLAMKDDMPIQLDYFADSANNKAFIGEDATDAKKRVLVKSKEEFTSLIQRLFKAGDDMLIATENSIYVVSGKIQKRRVNLSALMADE